MKLSKPIKFFVSIILGVIAVSFLIAFCAMVYFFLRGFGFIS